MANTLTYSLPLTHENIEAVLNWVAETSANSKASEKQIFSARLCSEELFMNLISHNKTEVINVIVRLNTNAGRLCLTIIDDGPSFNPLQNEPRHSDVSLDTARAGGWGIPFLHHFSDKFDYQRNDNKNIVLLEFNP